MRVVGVVITQFLEFVKKLQSHCKGYCKASNRWKSSTSWNSFAVLQWIGKTCPKTHPYPLGTIFARNPPDNSIHSFTTAKLQKQKTKKINQTIERVAFEGFAVFFAVALQFLDNLKNKRYNQAPAPHPWACLKALRYKHLLDANQTPETQALDKVLSKLKNALRFFWALKDKHLRPVRKSNTPPHFLKVLAKPRPCLLR